MSTIQQRKREQTEGTYSALEGSPPKAAKIREDGTAYNVGTPEREDKPAPGEDNPAPGAPVKHIVPEQVGTIVPQQVGPRGSPLPAMELQENFSEPSDSHSSQSSEVPTIIMGTNLKEEQDMLSQMVDGEEDDLQPQMSLLEQLSIQLKQDEQSEGVWQILTQIDEIIEQGNKEEEEEDLSDFIDGDEYTSEDCETFDTSENNFGNSPPPAAESKEEDPNNMIEEKPTDNASRMDVVERSDVTRRAILKNKPDITPNFWPPRPKKGGRSLSRTGRSRRQTKQKRHQYTKKHSKKNKNKKINKNKRKKQHRKTIKK